MAARILEVLFRLRSSDALVLERDDVVWVDRIVVVLLEILVVAQLSGSCVATIYQGLLL